MLGITGGRSQIAKELEALLPEGEKVERHTCVRMPTGFDRYFLCSGYLVGRKLREMSRREAHRTWHENFLEIALLCDRIFDLNPKARVCVMGSESGFAGSYDMAYAGSKAALHLYVERKKLLTPDQQLIAVAPTVIWDTGMTQRRGDLEALSARGRATRPQRWLQAREVAEVVRAALYGASAYLSNTVIRINGGGA